MKTISTQLQALFATRQFMYCGLYNFVLQNGGTLNYASSDVDIFLNASAPGAPSYWTGQTFSAGGNSGVGPYFDQTNNKAMAHWKIGVDVDQLTFDVIPGTSQVSGVPFLSAVREGVFDGAVLNYYGAYWAQQPYQPVVTPVGSVIKFVGRVGEVDAGRSVASFIVNSHLELLNQNMPRNLWQQSCVNTLFDSSCTLNASDFVVAGTALTGSSSSIINETMAAATGYYDLGVITFTSGINNGISRTIKQYIKGSPGTISLVAPFPNAPAAGDTFNAYPGCNKLQSTCINKFNNLINFRGFPYVPENSTAA